MTVESRHSFDEFRNEEPETKNPKPETFLLMANLIRIRRRHDGQAIVGKVNFAAPYGLFVQYDETDFATPSLKKATGTRAFSLMRDVVAQADLLSILEQSQLYPNSQPVRNPVLIGDAVSASRILEAEIEGAGLLLTSGTGALTGSTAVNAELSTKDGMLRAKQSGEEVAGWVRAQMTAEDTGNAFRLLVEFA